MALADKESCVKMKFELFLIDSWLFKNQFQLHNRSSFIVHIGSLEVVSLITHLVGNTGLREEVESLKRPLISASRNQPEVWNPSAIRVLLRMQFIRILRIVTIAKHQDGSLKTSTLPFIPAPMYVQNSASHCSTPKDTGAVDDCIQWVTTNDWKQSKWPV